MRQAEKSAHTKEKILTTAMALYEARGTDAVSVSEICQAAGIAVGTFYYYFSAKEDLFLHTNENAIANMEKMLGELESESDPGEYIQKFFYCYAVQNKKMGTSGIARLKQDQYIRSLSGEESRNRLFLLLEEKLSTMQRRGIISAQYSPTAITRELFISARGLIFEWCVVDGAFDLAEHMRTHLEPYIAYYIR